MSSNRLVSIILPTYNRCEMLAQTIQSCLSQTYKNIELLIVNDGSTDNTTAVVNIFLKKDTRVRYIEKRNGGLPDALNRGFNEARGDLLTWTSDDNRFLPEAIEAMVDFLSKNGEAEFVYSDYYDFFENEQRVHKKLPTPDVLTSWNCVGASFMYSRKVYETIGEYDKDLRLAEDYDYWLRVNSQFKIAHLAKPLYLYRRHSESLYSKFFYSVKILDVFTRLKNGALTRRLALNEFTFLVMARLKGEENRKKYHFKKFSKTLFNFKVKRIVKAAHKGKLSYTDAKDKVYKYVALKEYSLKELR